MAAARTEALGLTAPLGGQHY